VLVTRIGAVAAIRRYPVKSMGGEPLTEAGVETRGLAGDRAWAVVAGDGRLGSGKTSRRFTRVDGLLACTAVYDGATPVITLPGGDVVRAGDPHADARLSAALGRTVTLRPEGAVSHFDAAPVHLCATGAAAAVGLAAGIGPLDPRRLRPNLVVAADTDDWTGARLRVGATVELIVTEPTERCVMVNAAQEELPADGRVLHAVSDHGDRCLGVYASVARPGTIRVGDAVVLLQDPR
jgi:uncharacterized protein YcbX